MKQCPFCAEDIKDRALVCKHCGMDLYNKFIMTAKEKKIIYATILGFIDFIVFLFFLFMFFSYWL
jgi:hypothetical protein